jgi:hypothetical protein
MTDPLVFVRTITAFVPLKGTVGDDDRVAAIRAALRFLDAARHAAHKAGFEVQTVRIATDPFEVRAGRGNSNPRAAWSRGGW